MSLKNYYHIYDISQIKTYVNRKGTNIIKFGAKWCKPCVEIEPWYKSISKSYPNVRFISIDYNNSTKPAFRAYKIKGMPTFIGPSADEPSGGTLRFSGHWILTNVFATQADILTSTLSKPTFVNSSH